jgi:hypothetical protein
MFLLLAILLLGSPPALQAEKLVVEVTIAPDARSAAPEIDALQVGVSSLFARAYGRYAEVSFGAGTAAAGAEAADPGAASEVDAASAEPFAQVTIERREGSLVISSLLTQGAVTRSLQSEVPEGAPASLVATMAGDLAFLLFSLREFSAFPLAPPPRLTGILTVDALQALTGWDAEELEPVGLAGFADELTICFPHRYLTLGPLFRINASTLRDIHNQAAGPEQLQLSGVARDGDGRLLFSEKQRKIAAVDARSGTRRLFAAPELSALPARALTAGSLAILSGTDGAAALTVVSVQSGRRWQIRSRASYISALCGDGEGNVWVWDAGERRIRVFTQGGREVYAIRPLFAASTMQLPQQIEVYADGSFLLGGSGEVWKFENSGIPLWRLTRIPGRPAELLPSGFTLAANGTDGTFTLLDGPSRRLLSFAPVSASMDGSLGSLLSRLNRRNAAEVKEAADLARGSGLYLMAWQFGDLLARRGGAEVDLLAARVAILKQKTELYVELAESLMRDLRYDRADGACLRAAESARVLAAEAPDEPDAAPLLSKVISRRQEVRAALARQGEAPVIRSARARVQAAGGCERLLLVKLQVRNEGSGEMKRVAVRLSIPSVAPMPSQATIETLPARQQRELSLQLGLLDPSSGVLAAGQSLSAGASLTAGLLISFQRGLEESTMAATLVVAIGEPGSPPDAADPLICRARPGDPLIAGLVDDLTAGGRDALPALAGILDGLGALRAPPGQGAVDPDLSLRGTLRSLSPDERQWTLLTVSIAASLGLPAGLIQWPDRAMAMVDTGIPLSQAFASLPELQRFSAALGAMSRGGDLCIPLSGLPPRGIEREGAPFHASALALRDALVVCSTRGVGGARVTWLDSGSPAPQPQAPRPIPFPFLLPLAPQKVDTATMAAGVAAALSPPP